MCCSLSCWSSSGYGWTESKNAWNKRQTPHGTGEITIIIKEVETWPSWSDWYARRVPTGDSLGGFSFLFFLGFFSPSVGHECRSAWFSARLLRLGGSCLLAVHVLAASLSKVFVFLERNRRLGCACVAWSTDDVSILLPCSPTIPFSSSFPLHLFWLDAAKHFWPLDACCCCASSNQPPGETIERMQGRLSPAVGSCLFFFSTVCLRRRGRPSRRTWASSFGHLRNHNNTYDGRFSWFVRFFFEWRKRTTTQKNRHHEIARPLMIVHLNGTPEERLRKEKKPGLMSRKNGAIHATMASLSFFDINLSPLQKCISSFLFSLSLSLLKKACCRHGMILHLVVLFLD